jgi:hypothetical protein
MDRLHGCFPTAESLLEQPPRNDGRFADFGRAKGAFGPFLRSKSGERISSVRRKENAWPQSSAA